MACIIINNPMHVLLIAKERRVVKTTVGAELKR